MEHELNHLHLLVRANVHKPPEITDELNQWFLQLVELIDMKVFMEPNSIICNTLGNEGITGIVGLETSHSSAHFWTKVEHPFLQFDLFSCKYFDVQDVLDKLNDFEVSCIAYTLIDRNGFLQHVECKDIIHKDQPVLKKKNNATSKQKESHSGH